MRNENKCPDTTHHLSVINLSSYELPPAEFQVLSRGLTFCPEQNFKVFEAITDLQLFARRLLLKYLHEKGNSDEDTVDWSTYSMREFKAPRDLTLLYQENNTFDLIDQIDLDTLLNDVGKSTQNPTTMFTKASTKFPPSNTNPNVTIFLKQTIWNICKLPRTKCNPHNLTSEENKALNSLSKNIRIVVKPFDKGGNVVIMDNQDYILMCLNILNNKDWYKQISVLSISQYNTIFLQNGRLRLSQWRHHQGPL